MRKQFVFLSSLFTLDFGPGFDFPGGRPLPLFSDWSAIVPSSSFMESAWSNIDPKLTETKESLPEFFVRLILTVPVAGPLRAPDFGISDASGGFSGVDRLESSFLSASLPGLQSGFDVAALLVVAAESVSILSGSSTTCT